MSSRGFLAAIIGGLRESVETFRQSVEGATAKDVMALVLMIQYFDTLKEIGAQRDSGQTQKVRPARPSISGAGRPQPRLPVRRKGTRVLPVR